MKKVRKGQVLADCQQYGKNVFVYDDLAQATARIESLWPDLPEFEELDADETGVEIHKHHVFMQLAVPRSLAPESIAFTPIKVYLGEDALVILSKTERIEEKLCVSIQMISESGEWRRFIAIINMVLREAVEIFASIAEESENTIEKMEEMVFTTTRKNLQMQIIAQRKYLLKVKHNCEGIIAVCESLYASDRNLLDESGARMLKITKDKATRILNEFLMLRDYLTQVREAYDAERDIKANELMKVFTVITSIFLPLTLLVGWYGMNFRIFPEIHWAYGYPAVIIASVCITVGMLILFKLKKWL